MNTNAKINCDFGDERFRIAAAGLEKDIFVRTHLHTVRIVVRMTSSSNFMAQGGSYASVFVILV